MLNYLGTVRAFLRARWRMARGHCPRCNRNRYTMFPYYMAGFPNCPICVDGTEADLPTGHEQRALRAVESPAVGEVNDLMRPEEGEAPDQSRAVAFDLDAASLVSLQTALPQWKIEVVTGATIPFLARSWIPGEADLLVLGARESVTETLGLCRFLTSGTTGPHGAREEAAGTGDLPRSIQNLAQRVDAPLLVLVASRQGSLVGAALEAGAHSCLVLPIHAKEVASMVMHARTGNQAGRHTLDLEQAQHEDRWRDDGGQG